MQTLIARGVFMHESQTVCVDPDVAPNRVAPGVVLHPGCRLRRPKTSSAAAVCVVQVVDTEACTTT